MSNRGELHEIQNAVFVRGDSNLAGYSLSHEQNQSAQSLRGSYYGFAGIVSRMFNAEYSNISRSGATIRTLNASYNRIDWFTPGSSWDFGQFKPDVVVINIGANDVGRPKGKIKKDYDALLDDMRASYPGVPVVLFNAWGWDYDEPANYTHEVVASRGDPLLTSAIFPWLFEQWHGCEYDHSGMAHVLANHLNSVMGWIPGPADVLSGYGIDGDVANGSFEDVAPFGGYGWRYYTDNGVARIHDVAAPDGEYYLRLQNGAASHQPNPAMDGESFTVTAQMRGANYGDKVHMTIDFRDQEMWTSPLQSSTEIKTLTTSWQSYEISATAPTGTANPVFHTRITFTAANGSIVDIDDVSMSLSGGEECTDVDGDGYGNPGSSLCNKGAATDCDDSSAAINPGAAEVCTNGVDDNCNSQADTADPACPAACGVPGDSCVTNSDCCLGSCSKGKPSSRVCVL